MLAPSQTRRRSLTWPAHLQSFRVHLSAKGANVPAANHSDASLPATAKRWMA